MYMHCEQRLIHQQALQKEKAVKLDVANDNNEHSEKSHLNLIKGSNNTREVEGLSTRIRDQIIPSLQSPEDKKYWERQKEKLLTGKTSSEEVRDRIDVYIHQIPPLEEAHEKELDDMVQDKTITSEFAKELLGFVKAKGRSRAPGSQREQKVAALRKSLENLRKTHKQNFQTQDIAQSIEKMLQTELDCNGNILELPKGSKQRIMAEKFLKKKKDAFSGKIVDTNPRELLQEAKKLFGMMQSNQREEQNNFEDALEIWLEVKYAYKKTGWAESVAVFATSAKQLAILAKGKGPAAEYARRCQKITESNLEMAQKQTEKKFSDRIDNLVTTAGWQESLEEHWAILQELQPIEKAKALTPKLREIKNTALKNRAKCELEYRGEAVASDLAKEREAAETIGAEFKWPVFTKEISGNAVTLVSGEEIPADTVIISIGDMPDLEFLPDDIEIADGFVKVNHHFLTTDPKIFAIGDVVRPGLLTDAIGSGRIVAQTICDILEDRPPLVQKREMINRSRITLEYFDPRVTEYSDLDHCGSQCSSCGACRDCGICVSVCPQHAISRKGLDDDAYEYIVDEDLCIGCGFCAGACPCGVWDLVENTPLD